MPFKGLEPLECTTTPKKKGRRAMSGGKDNEITLVIQTAMEVIHKSTLTFFIL